MMKLGENVASPFYKKDGGTASVCKSLYMKGTHTSASTSAALETPFFTDRRMDGFVQSSSSDPLLILAPSSLLLVACVLFFFYFFFIANAGCSPRKTRAAKARSQSPSRARRRRRTRLRNLPPRAPVEVPYPSPPNPPARCEPPCDAHRRFDSRRFCAAWAAPAPPWDFRDRPTR